MIYSYYKRQRIARRCIRILIRAKVLYDSLLEHSPIGYSSENDSIDEFLINNFDVYPLSFPHGHGL